MHIELSGYNEYDAALSPENQLKLAGFAASVVASRLTPFGVQVISIIGHADKALLVPVADRPKKEMDVSIERAKTAENQLKAAMNAIPGGAAAVAGIQFLTSGVGARELKIPNTQDSRNRRVDITTVESQGGIIHAFPEWPSHIPNMQDPALQKVYSIKLMEGVAGGHLFQYTFVIWDKTASRAGAFDYRGVEGSAGPSSPFSSESDWADFLVPPTMTLEEFSKTNNAASHSAGTLGTSFMLLNLPHGSVLIHLGLGIGVSIAGGSGAFTLAAGSIKPFNGP
jgi:hypothetical protein